MLHRRVVRKTRCAPLLAALWALSCTPTPSVVLAFPDAASEAQAKSFTVAALPMSADCNALMSTGQFSQPIQVVTGTLPQSSPAHLGVVPRGQTVFFAEVRDSASRPFLRACQATGSGGPVVLTLQSVNRPPDFSAPATMLQMNEGETLVQDVAAADPDGTAVALSARGLPDFGAFDAQAGKLTFTPGPTAQGQYTFELDATEQRPMGVTVTRTVTLTVIDLPRPMVWSRLYRGWHGRFDAAALWDGPHHQLLVSGGRDVGVDLNSPVLFTDSLAADVLSDYRVLELNDSPAKWNKNLIVRSGTSGKYGHVMGMVKSPLGTRFGFVLGGSDGSEVSPETLILTLGSVISSADSPSSIQGSSYFLNNMGVAIEPDETATYLFGGDLALSEFHNQVFKVTATSEDALAVSELMMISPLGRPAPRTQAAVALAQNPKRLVVIGGRFIDKATANETDYADAWVLCLEQAPPKCPVQYAWSKVAATGDMFPGSGVHGVFALAAGYDPATDRVITYGGLGVLPGTPPASWLFEDAFALDLSASTVVDAGFVSGTWTKLPNPENADGPYGLVAAAAAADPDGGRLLLYGGMTGRLVNGQAQLDITEDVWQLGLTQGNVHLTKLPATGFVPYPERRVSPTLTWRGDLLLFGGEGEGTEPSDQWIVRGDGGVESIMLPGTSPLPRAQFAIAYNPDLDEYWGYGGRVGNLRPNAALYRLKGDAGFTQMPEDLLVEPRFGQTTVYDTRNHRLVNYGGVGGNGPLGDLFALSLDAGTLVHEVINTSGPAPFARYGSVAGYDKAGQRLVLFGGTANMVGSQVDQNDVWQLSLVAGQEAWKQLMPKGTAPPAMYLPAGVLTAENPPVMYVFGTVVQKSGLPKYSEGLWKLTLAPGSEEWSQFLPLQDFRPRARLFPTVVYDDVQHRMLLTSGAQDPVFRNDIWALTLP
jgi:hypothetical protein